MNPRLAIATSTGLLAIFLVPLTCASQAPVLAQAKALYEQASVLPFGDKEAVALYRKAIDLDPDYFDAEQSYIMAASYPRLPGTASPAEEKAADDKAHDEVKAQYMQWAQQHPDRAVYQWALGFLWTYQDPLQSDQHFRQALAIDPKYGPAYDSLAIALEEEGKPEESKRMARKAHEAWPLDLTIYRHYISTYTIDCSPEELNKAHMLALTMAEKYPTEGAGMLAYIAGRMTDEAAAVAQYEALSEKYPAAVSATMLAPLFNAYLSTEPRKALTLTDRFLKQTEAQSTPQQKANYNNWKSLHIYADAVVQAKALMQDGKAKEALALVQGLRTPPRYATRIPLDLLKAQAMTATGDGDTARTDLQKLYAAKPNRQVYDELVREAREDGRTESDVQVGIKAQRAALAKPGAPFTLVDYATGKPVSLADYKGKTVLVNFWYPKCGPCRGEFPYLQATLDRFRNKGFTILAINGHAPEDDMVLPLMRGWKLDFIPLKGTPEVIAEYKVLGFPKNVLYGPDGQSYPMPSPINSSNLTEFQLQVEALLRMSASQPPHQLETHGQ